MPTAANDDNVVTAVLTNNPVVGKVTAVAAVDVIVVVNAPAVAKVAPSAIVNVALVVGAVIATLLTPVVVSLPILKLSYVALVKSTVVVGSAVTLLNNFHSLSDALLIKPTCASVTTPLLYLPIHPKSNKSPTLFAPKYTNASFTSMLVELSLLAVPLK